MRLGLDLSLTRRPALGGVVPAFNPLSISPTAWYDPSDMSTLFQDSAGTVPVTATGQPVGRINDKSGNGFHFIQATTAAKPTLQIAAGLSWLEHDGTDDRMATSANIGIIGDSLSEYIAAARYPVANSGAHRLILGLGTNGVSRINRAIGTDNVGNWWEYLVDADLVVEPVVANTNVVFTARMGGGNRFGQINNNTEVGGTAGGALATTDTPLELGSALNGGFGIGALRFYGAIIVKRALSSAERANTKTFLGTRAGLSI